MMANCSGTFQEHLQGDTVIIYDFPAVAAVEMMQTGRVVASCSQRPSWLAGMLLPGGVWGSPFPTGARRPSTVSIANFPDNLHYRSGEVSESYCAMMAKPPCSTHLSIVSLRICWNNNPPPHTDPPPPPLSLPHLRWQHIRVSWSAEEGDGVSME